METDYTGFNFGEFFANLPPFISQILDFIYWTVLILFLTQWNLATDLLEICPEEFWSGSRRFQIFSQQSFLPV